MPTNKELEADVADLRRQLRLVVLRMERLRSAVIELAGAASAGGNLAPAQMIVIRKALG